MKTTELIFIALIVAFGIWLLVKFFRADIWSKLDRRINRYQNNRDMQQLENDKKNAEAYFREVMVQHFESSSKETHPAFEVTFGGLKMTIGSAPTSLLGHRQNHVVYTYRYDGNMICCDHSDRRFTKSQFEKELNLILNLHSVVPRN